MANYIYLPVPSAEMEQSAQYVTNFWGPIRTLRNPYLRGWKKGRTRLFGGGCLRGLGAADKLFILIHQYYGSVAASRHPELRQVGRAWQHDHDDLKTYTAAQLASVMEKEGLPKTFGQIYACICNSALRHPQAQNPFGQALSTALIAAEYPGISVTGFQGFFRPGAFGIFVEVNNNLVQILSPDTIRTAHANIITTYAH